jgi:glycosyltransferase involved in cell wall biosynthesis
LLIEKLLAIIATDRIVVLSDKQSQEIHEKYGIGNKEQFDVVPLGIDIPLKNISNHKKDDFKTEFGIVGYITIGIVGRIAPIKNHTMFIDAAEKFVRYGIDKKVRFIVIGGGTDKDLSELKNYAKMKNIYDSVIFCGNRYDVGNFCQDIDIFVLTSRNEGTPLSLIEGMAAGKPFVATDVGGIRDLMVGNVDMDNNGNIRAYKNGILVDSDDTLSFARALAMLVEDKNLRIQMGREGKEFVEARYSIDRLIRDMEKLYLSLYLGN